MTQAICCVIIDEHAADTTLTAQLPAALPRIAAACTTQLQRDVAPAYGGTYGVRVGTGPADVQPGEMVFALLDALPQAPGAIAFHDVNGQAVPVAFLALSTCSTLDDISTAISHELCETAGDAACDLWADDGQGHEVARELADAVESNSYPIDLGDGGQPVNVSDFLLPSFFAENSAGPYSYMQAAPSPATHTAGFPPKAFATASGGYQIQRTSGGGETQITGSMRPARLERAKHWSSRTHRRGVRV